MSSLNGPNTLTLLRVLMVPFFVWCLSLDGLSRWLTLGVFLLAALTDLVDGWWARRSSLVTDFGRLADPIADKALTGAAWIGLSLVAGLPPIATALILIRELGITVLRLRVASQAVVAADRGGKLKTTLQVVTISVWLVAPSLEVWLGESWAFLLWVPLMSLLWLTVAITTLSGVRYLGVLLPALRSRA